MSDSFGALSKLREAFSNGKIAVHENGFFVIYYGPAWVNQYFENDILSFFIELCKQAEVFFIDCSSPGFIKIGMKLRGFVPAGSESIFQPTVERANTKMVFDGLVIDEDGHIETGFSDVGTRKPGFNPEYLEQVFLEIANRLDERERTNVLEFPRVSKWPRMRELFSKLTRFFVCETEVNEQDPGLSYGSLSLYLREGEVAVFEGETKADFLEMLELSDAFELECNVKDGFANLVFYG